MDATRRHNCKSDRNARLMRCDEDIVNGEVGTSMWLRCRKCGAEWKVFKSDAQVRESLTPRYEWRGGRLEQLPQPAGLVIELGETGT